MSRRMFRYSVPIDDEPHAFSLTGQPVAVAAREHGNFYTEAEFWAEHDDSVSTASRYVQVFGTGHPLPDDARWIGTCPRTADGLVWHLYEVTQP